MKMRLLIVDDDPGIAGALARGMALQGYETFTENRADRALDRLVKEHHDAAIVDVMLGEDSGIEVVRTARARGVTLPILMLSALSEVEHRAAGLEAGADDYVIKPFDFAELVARLKVQTRRAETRRPIAPQFDLRKRTVSRGAAEIALTEREADLLRLLRKAAPEPMARSEIFDRLWAAEGSGSENVVDVYIGYIRKKLATQDLGFGIKTIRNRGFCLDGVAPVLVGE
ncbi:response regulator transcription factor [Sagittula sp. NFXS13]|uniref:response regulator transcription factor n=1 Tax=Sagittula sp. NFXS13 TaxID=2819095 RepID=UPI0032E01E1C